MTPFSRVTFRDEAMQDLRRLAERSQPVLLEVFRLLKALDPGSLLPAPLHDDAKIGDPTDCGKIVVLVEGDDEHRIVVRDVGDGGFEVGEVITVEDRTGDLP